MTHICTCEYPLLIIDNRSGQNIEYLALPTEVIHGEMGGEPFEPIMDTYETEGLDGIIRLYMAVVWKEPDHDGIKKYDVKGHIVYAGCSLEDLQCDTKSIYAVLHPIDEWLSHHIIELKKEEPELKQ